MSPSPPIPMATGAPIPTALNHHIGGAEVPSQDGAFDDVFNPATGALIAHQSRGRAADIDRAVAAAKVALTGPWGRANAAARADILDAIAHRITRRAIEFAQVACRDTGQPLALARHLEVPHSVDAFRYYAALLRQDAPRGAMEGMSWSLTARRPLGVVGILVPWTQPLSLLSWRVAGALAGGNSIVAKPSRHAPMSAGLLAATIAGAGLPPGVFNLVFGRGDEAGVAIAQHPEIDAISAAGCRETARALGIAAAETGKALSMELGGNNATIVLADAEIEQAADGAARSAFLNQGQIAQRGARILVDRRIAPPFIRALIARAAALEPGDPEGPKTQMGAMISDIHRDAVEAAIERACAEGGTIRVGGDRPDLPPPMDAGAFLRPTVITGLPLDAPAARECLLGPVVTVHEFEGARDAVNACTHWGARHISIWTRDMLKAQRLAPGLKASNIWVNHWLDGDPRAPRGGPRALGSGREGGPQGLDFYTEPCRFSVVAPPEPDPQSGLSPNRGHHGHPKPRGPR